jgi:hypothetical protein
MQWAASVSEVVLVLAVMRLCRTATFLPAPAEFYEAVRTERENLEDLLNESIEGSLVWLAKSSPAVPIHFTDEEIQELERECHFCRGDYTFRSALVELEMGFMPELPTVKRKAAIVAQLRFKFENRNC